MAARSYTRLKNELSKEQFDSMAKKITEKYASTEIVYSQTEVAKDFDVTVDCVRKMMDYAIVWGLVTRKVAILVNEKAISNQQRKCSEAGGSSKRHHEQLIEQREDNLAGLISESKVSQIAKFAIQNPENDFAKAQKQFGLESKRHMYNIFRRSIEESVLNKDDALKLTDLILKRYPVQFAMDYWKNVWDKREEKEKECRQLTFEDLWDV